MERFELARGMSARLLTALSLATVCAIACPQKPYFPSHTLSKNPNVDSLVIGWYSRQLAALQEPSLWQPASSRSNETYRFLWLRTFHHPIAVRLEVLADGAGALTTKIATGAGGYAPGKLTTNKTVNLTKDQVNSFLARVDLDKFWSLPSDEETTGLDGSEWIVEANREGRYHVVFRWTPKDGPIHDLGIALAIELAKIDIPKQEFN